MSETIKRSHDELECEICGHGIHEHTVKYDEINQCFYKICFHEEDKITCKCPN